MNTSLHLVRGSAFNCLDFRREKLADPRHLSAAATQHLHECEACQRFAARADQLESQIAETLAVPVPEGLSDRIILRARREQQKPWRMLALAASVVLTVALGVSQLRFEANSGHASHLALSAAAHAGDEAAEMRQHPSLAASQFGLILSNFGGDLQAPIGRVDYIHFCPIEGFGMGWHIRMQTASGGVTLLLVPGAKAEVDNQTVTVNGMQVLIQRAGQGYYALIADDRKALDAAGAAMQRQVRWKS